MSSVVLVAEDEPMIARILEHKLTREGHSVVRAVDVAGVHAAVREGVDVALVDVTLDEDGIAAAAGWRSPEAPRAGWLALVEARRPADAARALAAGAAGVVVNPFKPTQVADVVRRLLTGSEP